MKGLLVGVVGNAHPTNLIQQTSGQQRTDELFAAVLTSAALGMMMFGAVCAAGRMVTLWWSGSK